MCTLPKQNDLPRRGAEKSAPAGHGSRITAGLVLLIQLVMMHPYAAYGEPPRPAPPEAPLPDPSLPPEQDLIETLPGFSFTGMPDVRRPGLLSGGTAAGEADTVRAVSETAENSGMVHQREPEQTSRFVSAEAGGFLVLGDTEIEIPPGALAADTEIGISRLFRPADTGEGLINITAGGGAYRFEPAGLVFNKAVTIRIAYDPRLGENEPALEHSYTYFYDAEERRWEKLERLALERDRRRIISLTTHFTDMINGTLTLPESPKPLQFDINSIKDLKAADPGAGVLKLEGLDADNSGTASFQFELNLPPGRNGMAPRVAVAYSSDGENGIMGRGFDLQYGSRITIDTRWGLPQYDGRDAYMLDGVKLRETGRTGAVIRYQAERETKYELIEHYRQGPYDYWMITGKTGVRRIYGKQGEPGKESWTGEDAAKKYRWELEEERDLYGNTVRYSYEQDRHYPYIKKIRYTNYQDAANADTENGAYTVEFGYRGRRDIQLDGRGKFLSERQWLLEQIIVTYNNEPIRTYLCTYKENYYGIPQLVYFGEEDPAKPGEYWWRYGFTYEEPEKDGRGQYSIFGPQETWDLDNGLQVQQGVSGGANGSAAAGVGVSWANPYIDSRITGGGHGGVSAGMNQSKQTMVDINGDGRPDSVRRALQGLMVSLNLGDRFDGERLYEIDVPGLDESANMLATYGWNTFAGKGFPPVLGSLGYSYAETKQNGWTDTNTGFTDIDGDGVADIAIQGQKYYYRNTSHETGRIGFEKMPLVKASGERIEDVLEPLSDAARTGYNKTYFRQLPFRAWRPPYTGRISAAQSIVSADGELSADGIAARTYAGNDGEADAEFALSGGRPAWTAEETRRSYRMNAGEPVYFIGDPLWDTRGDDLIWNITVNYETIRYLEDMDKRIRYLPEKQFVRLPAKRLEGPLRAIYTETENKAAAQYGQGIISYTYNIKEQWESAVSPADDLDEARRILIRQKRFVPGLILAEDFELLLAAVSGMDEETGTNYYEALCSYYIYDAGNGRYYVNQKNRSLLEKTAWENLEVILQTLVEQCDDDGIDALAGYRWDKAVPVLTHYDPVRRRVYHQESGETWYERALDVPGYQNGQEHYLYLDTIEGSVLKLNLDTGVVRQNALALESAVLTPGAGGALTVELPGEAYTLIYRFGGFEAAAKILYREELDWIGAAVEEAGESWETVMTQLVLYYEPAPDGNYLLREGQEHASWVASFNAAYKLGSWRSVERIIRYYADGEYAVQHNRLRRLVPDSTGYHYEDIDLEEEGLTWNSGEDYSPENLVLSPLQYRTSVESPETGGTEPVDREMAVAECLYGGVRQWYYGIWTGDQPGKSFSGAAIEEQRNGAADPADMAGIEGSIGRDIKKTEDTLGRMDQPLEEGMIESRNQGPVYLGVHENRGDDGALKLVRDSGTGRTVTTEALIGDVSTRVQNRLDPSGEVNRIVETYAPYIEGDRIHPDRLGGNVFYEIPGIAGETAEPAGDGPGPMTMVNIRKSVNQGTDIVSGLNLSRLNEIVNLTEALTNISSTASGVSNDDKNTIQKAFAIATFSRNSNTNNSYMTQNVQDINGDGIADIVQGRGSSLWVTPGSREGFKTPYPIGGSGGRLSAHRTESRGSGGYPGSLGSLMRKYSSSGSPKGESINGAGGKDSLSFSGGITYAGGTSVQQAGLADINGDGLPDYINGGGILNIGEHFIPYESFISGPVNKAETTTIGGSFAISTGKGNVSIESTGGGYAVSGGVSYSVSVNQTTETLLDINGDGLPDKIKKPFGSDEFTIYLNQGNRFMSEPVSARAADWDLRTQDYVMFQSVTDGNLMSGAVSAMPGVSGGLNGILDMPVIEDALQQMGAEDLLNNADDRGIAVNPFGFFINNYINSLDLNTTISLAVNAEAKIVYMYTFFAYFFGFINISAGAGGGTNMGTDLSGISVQMMDIDGDGLVDRVLRIPGSDRIYVRRNLLGKAGLLKRIDLPQGGAYDLHYAWVPGTSDMPQSRYVLAELAAGDGNGKPGYRNLPYGEHVYTVKYNYGAGRYDRKVKEFYGFDQVTAVYADGSKKIDSYYNGDYYSKGMIKSETIQDMAGTVLRFTKYEIDEAPYARPVLQNRLVYEAGSPDPVETGSAYQYDRYGNIRLLEEYAGGTEDIRAEIRYRDGDNPNYLHAHPLEIAVYGSQSGLLRRRLGTYDWDTGALLSVTVYTDQNTSIAGELTWDQYGNLERIKDSRGAWTAYAYDGETHQYTEQIRRGGSGAGPYVSEIQWNKKYGMRIAETDENGNVITCIPDRYGRISEIWSPYDRYGTGGRIPSVRYDYFTSEEANWYSVTENKISFDPLDEKRMGTVLMLDGLGRNLYTAKQGEQRDGGGSPVKGWNVSGAAAYDRKGRLTEEGQNQFVEGDLASLMAWTGGSLKNPVISAYDSLDRPVEKVLPDGSAWSYDYGIDGGRSYTRIRDPLGNRSVQERDGRDNIIRVSHYDTGMELLTGASYRYNGIGELLEALDHKDNPLRVEYDLAGRRTAVESRDLGRREYRYDEAGNLAAERDGVLRQQGKWIQYAYDGLNRLIMIRYPKRSDTEGETETVYTYGLLGADHNGAGRITGIRDESGDTAYRYGLLGETVWTGRHINTMDVSRNGGAKFKDMSYTGNYLGQMEQIIYPDGERIRYEYDHGGQIRRVTGLRENAEFVYVDDIGYDEFGQRTFIRYGNGVSTRYRYDEKRRWLLRIQTEQDGTVYQNISYDFDPVGNIREYVNAAGRYTTQQRYTYDGLYQLTGVNGASRQYLHSAGNEEAYTASYSQDYRFDSIGNMTGKTSRGTMTNNARMGSDLNYDMMYRYYEDYAHRAEQIGDLYYQYDENGNLLVERFGGPAGTEPGRPVYYEDGVYSTDYGFALTVPENETAERQIYQRNYTWDYRNQLIRTKDNRYTIRYRYGADGRRALKYTEENRNETLYYNNMWQMSMTSADSRWLQSKHIFVGNSRIATKSNYEGERNLGFETNHQYWYHGDHIGSAQMITNTAGKQHERIEYTPYGETWIEHRYDEDTLSLPYRFTGKELDEETGLYYYGARYLDPKTSRWISADPAMGEYIPAAPVNDEAHGQNRNLPGMGGIFNLVNLHVYHYAGNNPVKYVDPDGRIDLVGIYNRNTDTLDIHVVMNNSSHTSVRAASYSASGHVLDRSQTGPVMGTNPGGKDAGQSSQYYIPQELPNGTYQLGHPIRFEKSNPKYKSLGPVFVPILVTQEVPVYGITQPERNLETGMFDPIGTQIDAGYGVHAIMIGDNTTWGCVGTNSKETRLDDAIKFADWVRKAINSGGNATLTIW